MNKVYDIITDRIVAELEKGVVPWRKPWQTDRQRDVFSPTNLVSMKPYRGINAFLLAIMPYTSPYWVTFNQAKQLGGTVRKGEKSTPVVFYRKLEVEDAKTKDGKKQIPLLRYYAVFNLEQTEGVRLPVAERPAEPHTFNPIDEADRIVAGYPNGPQIVFGGRAQAFYMPVTDTINMPERERFNSPEHYYHTLFHEMTHSTGAHSRLDRDLTGAFGSDPYMREELIAEMGAAYLSGHAGILAPVVENAAAYIGGWIKKLREDNKLVIQAAAQAQKAADYVVGESAQAIPQEEAAHA